MRFVGGCVRDTLLNLPVHEVDLATTYRPDQVMAFLTQAKIKVVPSGLDHGTVMAVMGGQGFEVTTLRRDVATDGRHAVVAFTDRWEEDAARRDFTFNALYLSKDGDLYDPWQGVEDLKQGIVRFIGDPNQRLQEDYLRLFRFFRFYARFGKQKPSLETLQALEQHKEGLETISGERIHSELFRMLGGPAQLETFLLMETLGILEKGTHYTKVPDFFKNLLHQEQHVGKTASSLAHYYALVDGEPHRLAWAKKRLRFSTKEAKKVLLLGQLLQEEGADIRGVLYHYGPEEAWDWFLLTLAQGKHQPTKDLEILKTWTPKIFPLTGEDLKAQGLSEGPILGKTLKALEQAWIDSDFTLTADELKQKLLTLKKVGL